MSLLSLVVELVDEKRRACVDDLMPEIEEYTREQVLRALHKAAHLKMIGSEGVVHEQGHMGTKPTYYTTKKPTPSFRRVGSVFELYREAR